MEINKVYNLDCLDFLKQIESNSVDLIVVDPPYNLHRFDYGNKSDFQKDEEYKKWCEQWMKELTRVLKSTGSLYCWISKEYLGFYQQELNKLLKYRNTIIWYYRRGRAARGKNYNDRFESCLFYTKNDNYCFNIDKYYIPIDLEQLKKDKGYIKSLKFYKQNPVKTKQILERLFSQGKLMVNVWDDIGHSPVRNGGHPNEKPIKLIERCILMSSNDNDLVLDCFGGVGTTFIAAIKNKRNFIGCEIEEKWVKETELRLNYYKELYANHTK